MSSSEFPEKSSPPASAIVADASRGYHILQIDGYSLIKGTPTGEVLRSGQFTVCGHCWRIQYYPNGDRSDSMDYVSLYLLLDQTVTRAVKAKSKFSFADRAEKQPSLTSSLVDTFRSNGSWGRRKFIKREDFEKSEHLKDDSFTIRCNIIVINGICTKDSRSTAPKFVSVPPSDLNRQLGSLLKTEKGTDVVFKVGRETFAAHRCVLAARSPVFSAELFGLMKEGDTAGVVRIDDMEAQVLRALICFAYTDSLPEMKKEEEDVMCQHLLVAADRYDMARLKLICEEKYASAIHRCGHGGDHPDISRAAPLRRAEEGMSTFSRFSGKSEGSRGHRRLPASQQELSRCHDGVDCHVLGTLVHCMPAFLRSNQE